MLELKHKNRECKKYRTQRLCRKSARSENRLCYATSRSTRYLNNNVTDVRQKERSWASWVSERARKLVLLRHQDEYEREI